MVLEHIVKLMVNPSLDLVFAPLLDVKLEILDLSWAIFDALAHLMTTII
jgi:hypothetical protein